MQGGLKLIHDACRDDGRVRVAPKAPMYPCYTAEAVRVLCRFGWKTNNAVKRSVRYFIESVHDSGGWRCDFSKFGRGPETAYANPGATLYVLDVLRWFPKYRKPNETVDGAVEFLLNHWESRKPIGPCQWGIGKQFMQVEFPFLRYNLFYYVYVLSFFQVAKKDKRFKVAVEILKSKLDDKGQLVVEKPHRLLQRLEFCAKGQPSKIATSRYREIQKNLSK